MLQWKMDNIFSFVILDVPPGPGFISTSPDNNNKLMRSKLKEITEYIDLNLVNAVLHKACTYNINQCKMSYNLKDTISLTFLQQTIPIYDKTTQLQFYVLQHHYPLSKISNIT